MSVLGPSFGQTEQKGKFGLKWLKNTTFGPKDFFKPFCINMLLEYPVTCGFFLGSGHS